MTGQDAGQRAEEIQRHWHDQHVIRERMRSSGVEPSPSWYDDEIPYLLARVRELEGRIPKICPICTVTPYACPTCENYVPHAAVAEARETIAHYQGLWVAAAEAVKERDAIIVGRAAMLNTCQQAIRERDAEIARLKRALGAMAFDTSEPGDEMDCGECATNERFRDAALKPARAPEGA